MIRQNLNKQPRADKLNEHYYAENNRPTFSQFNDYHFYDDDGRIYMIADENKDVFQNKRLRYTPTGSRCVTNNYDEVTLYVKLPRNIAWFSERDTGHSLQLHARSGTDTYIITLRTTMKENPKRRTGTITVSGLGRVLCDRILNSRIY